MLAYSHRVHQAIVQGAAALEIRNLYVAYPGTRRLALCGLNLTVPVGARAALLGHNGAGKSTLLKAIAGLLPVQRGTICIYGNPPGACHHRTAYLPQRGEIDWRFPITLRELVMTGRYAHLGWLRSPTRRDWQIVDEVIEALGLTELRERQIGQLSGGQQQRAMLARALAQESDLLLLDEPLNAVDAETRAILSEVLKKLHQQGKTLVVATHDLSRLDEDYDLAFKLSGGRRVLTQAEVAHG
ncbi:MAG: ABC transporter ATP-binding protein [Anaerolineae bacterium]|nr:ABC transporter ATP-binding protein [Anaerolineae bacterium]